MGENLTISLDIGNTLIGLDNDGFCADFRRRTAVPREILRPLFFDHFLTKDQPLEDAVRHVCDLIGYDNPQQLIDEFVPAPAFLFEDTLPALSRLKQHGIPLIAISNCTPWEAGGLNTLGVDEFLDRVFYSYSVGFAKPDPLIFRHVQKELGARPESMIHVGDSWTADVEGALSVGWNAVFLAREGTDRPSSSDGIEVPVIKSLEELPELVKGMLQGKKINEGY